MADKKLEDLGFGHFSTAETENDWKWRSYDGLESCDDFMARLEYDSSLTVDEKIAALKELQKLKEKI